MADNVLTIRIEGDASGAGQAFSATNEQVVNLRISLDSAGAAGRSAGAGIAEGGKVAEYSMMEARHGVMMLGEELGVHIPRGVAGLIASLGPLGTAFAAAFPIIAIVLMAQKITELIDKHEALAEAARISGQESADLAIKQNDLVEGLHRANLELSDQIAKLEGGVPKNQLAIAMSELKEKTDQLAASFGADFDKMDKDIATQLGWWDSLKRGFSEYMTSVGESQDQSGQLSGATQQVAADNKALVDSLNAVRASEERVRDAKLAVNAADAGTDAWKIAVGQLATEYGKLQTASVNAFQQVQKNDPENTAALNHFREGAHTAEAGWKSMAAELERAGQTAIKVTDEQIDAANRLADEVFKKNAAEQRRADDEAEHRQEDNIKKAIAAVQQGEKLKIEATLSGTKARMDAVDAQLADEESKGLQETEYYKSLQSQKIEAGQAYANKIKETYKELEKAQDELLQSEIRLRQAQTGGDTASAADAIKDRMQRGVESVRQGTAELAALYKQDAQNRINDEQLVVAQLQSQEATARANLLAAEQSGDAGRIQQAQAMLDQIIAKENDAATKIVDINKEKDKRIAELDKQRIQQVEQFENQFNSMFANNVAQVLQGHETIKQAALKMYQEMTISMIKYFIEKELKRVEDLALEKLGLLQSTAAHALTAAAQTPINSAAVVANAAVAASSAAAASGPAAPAVAAGVFADIEGTYGPLAAVSADVGGMMEGGLTLTHAREAVLTPAQTARFQSMTDSPAPGGKGGGTTVIAPVVHVHGDFNADEHMPQIWSSIQDKMEMMGVRI